ncbi:HEAT repeat domain-containing protein [Photobacterium lutimaris]|uniref:HEAT repeat domain-containing protein n=1 Tax=Photobacterium lutimaris TaxID=388278 RepID=A0A2T3J2G7_9GAMM|nr:HEAT repeat domain-containing protein [Photobacterium lutimaris]PSU35488.1 hypothetical protein C9I99_00240 [Photobacterium lutimaris]TDR78533.1 hypothetical protein DFP78_10144 [Photobacterium lutimaris]
MISEARKKRGEIDASYIKYHQSLFSNQLVLLINDKDPQKRSVAATILGERKWQQATPILCERLSKEKSLYSKIAISDAIVELGSGSIPELVSYIGKVGKNQHHRLPDGIFRKKSYPLPRDIIIRTIIRMKTPALPHLQALLVSSEPKVLLEVVDAIGFITFYSKDYRALDDMLSTFDLSFDSEILRWKVIRSFQSFPKKEVVHKLDRIFRESDIAAHRWEAVRSLAQIRIHGALDIVRDALQDSDEFVSEMAEIALRW